MVSNLESVKDGNQVTILFADVVGSTHLYEALGDDKARETVQDCVDIMRQATEQYGGSVIKTIGDEVMSTFPSADDALNAGSQMQQRITNNSQFVAEGIQVSIRIGCHYGPVIIEDRDIHGVAVSTANKMTSQAKAGQMITTAATVEQLSGEWKALVRQIDVARVRGHADDVGVYEVLWQPDEATSMSLKPDFLTPDEATNINLHLHSQGHEVVVGAEFKTNITLGRADENDVVIKGKLISRVHARIELTKNKFFLIDESTNGTFVQRDDAEEIYVRRDRAELTGSGTIGLGRAADKGTDLAIEFAFLD
jgi:adenylate cyclase